MGLNVQRLVIESVTDPFVENIVIAAPNVEQDYALPAETRRFEIRTRNGSLLKVNLNAGTSLKYFTVRPGSVYTEEYINKTATVTLKFQSPQAGDTVEIKSWK